MSAVICPRCNQATLTWHIDSEKSPKTQWLCSNCQFSGQEDENKLESCPQCHKKTLVSITDSDQTIQFCTNCGYKTPTTSN